MEDKNQNQYDDEVGELDSCPTNPTGWAGVQVGWEV